MDGVAPDLRRGEFRCGASCDAADGEFSGAVGGYSGAADDPVHGGNIDDRSAGFHRPAHVLQKGRTCEAPIRRRVCLPLGRSTRTQRAPVTIVGMHLSQWMHSDRVCASRSIRLTRSGSRSSALAIACRSVAPEPYRLRHGGHPDEAVRPWPDQRVNLTRSLLMVSRLRPSPSVR